MHDICKPHNVSYEESSIPFYTHLFRAHICASKAAKEAAKALYALSQGSMKISDESVTYS
jgi:hypothetical protein